MDRTIASLTAFEILDSRGNPTIRVRLSLASGLTVSASVPSGASTGENEAAEKRDGDAARYGGRDVRQAVAAVCDVIAPALLGTDSTRQTEIDNRMIELDGTSNKSNLGANAILGVSMAVCRAAAAAAQLPLYAYLGGATARRLPMPMMNVLNPNTNRRITQRRSNDNSRPIINSSSTTPSRAIGSIASGLLMVMAESQGNHGASDASPNGPTTIPTRMEPSVELTCKR
jgi:Enolase, N-terminal domain